MINTDLIKYYSDRAAEYEKIYHKPERQQDLTTATTILQNIFTRKEVFEIACGTGFWTEKIAAVAASVFATDINQAVIDMAKQKTYTNANVNFAVADIFHHQPAKKYETLFGGFIWSHILLQDIDMFLTTVNTYLSAGGTVVFIDNNYVEGSNIPIIYKDEQGNTYQTRKLDDNTTHLVLKNFPTEVSIISKLKDMTTEIQFINLTYYWILMYKTI